MAVSCMRNASGHNNRNSSFIVDWAMRQIPRSNDLELRNSPYFAFFHRIRQIFRPIISQWLKIDL